MEDFSGKVIAAFKGLLFKIATLNALRLVEVDDSTLTPAANSQSSRSLGQMLLSAIQLVGGKPALRVIIDRPYKVYTALVTQAGTAVQTVKVLQNTLGAVTLAYEDVGIYQFNSAALFTADKTAVIVGMADTALAEVRYEIASTSRIKVKTFQNDVQTGVLTSTATNALLTDTLVEIRVYK